MEKRKKDPHLYAYEGYLRLIDFISEEVWEISEVDLMFEYFDSFDLEDPASCELQRIVARMNLDPSLEALEAHRFLHGPPKFRQPAEPPLARAEPPLPSRFPLPLKKA